MYIHVYVCTGLDVCVCACMWVCQYRDQPGIYPLVIGELKTCPRAAGATAANREHAGTGGF